MKAQRERAQERPDKRLEDVQRQVGNGGLIIRAMTEGERERFPPPDPNRPQRKRRWV